MATYKFICAFFISYFLTFSGICQHYINQDIFKNSIQKNLTIAYSLMDENKEDSALVYLNALLAKKYDQQEALFLRAKIRSNQGESQKALTDYNALLSLNADHKEALYARGTIRYGLSQYTLALSDFERVIKLPDNETNTAFFKMDEGGNRASGINTMSGMKIDTWNNIGLCYLGMNQYEQAMQSFNEGMKIDAKAVDLYINRAIAYEKLDQTNLAMQDYEYVLKMHPSHVIATHNLIQLQASIDVNHSQLESLNEFIEENPHFAQGFASRGLYHFENGEYEASCRDFKKAIKIQPENIDYLFNLALCQDKLSNSERAEALFIRVLESDPGHSGAYFNLGNLQFKQNHLKEAISYYTIAHNLNPENIYILFNRALTYHKQGHVDKACEDMEEVRKSDHILANPFYQKYCIAPQ